MSYADQLLTSSETIVRRERQHWMFPFYIAGKWVAIAFGVAVVGFVLAQFVFKSDGTGLIAGAINFINQLVWWATLIALAIAAVGFVVSIVQWRSQEYILTNHRVIHARGIVNKQSSDSSLEGINDAQINVPWLGRIFGFGDLRLMTAAEGGVENLRALHDPIAFKKAMLDAKSARQVEINTGRTQAQAAAYAAAAPVPPAAPAAPAPAPATPVPTAQSSEEAARALASLAALRDSGAITPEEFEAKKQELLDRI